MAAPGLRLEERPVLERYIENGKLVMPYSFPFRKQPIKGLYVVYRFITLLVLLPFWTLRYALPSWRPRASWTLKQALYVCTHSSYLLSTPLENSSSICEQNRYVRWLSTIGEMIGVSGRTHKDYTLLPLPSIKDHSGFVLIPPAASDLVTGSIKAFADKAGVRPETIIGYWFGDSLEDRPVEEDEVVVMNMHGGGYIFGTAHPNDETADIPKGLARYGERTGTISRVLSVEYRLSVAHPFEPRNPFPTALLDALSGYTYLLSCGFKPHNILLSGDSAGGNLALALTRYLLDARLPAIPPPSGLILISPWVDMSMQHNRPGGSLDRNWASDYLGRSTLNHYALIGFIGPHSPQEYLHNAYMSPASPFLPEGVRPFDTRWPRTMIVCGGAEVMADEIRSLRHVMETGGVNVRWLEVEDAVHDFFAILGFAKQSELAFEAIVEWVKGRK
jgi:acetyl esterase/lipase